VKFARPKVNRLKVNRLNVTKIRKEKAAVQKVSKPKQQYAVFPINHQYRLTNMYIKPKNKFRDY